VKKTDWKKRLICWAIPLAVGGLAALLSGGMSSYKIMNQPPLSPPAWVFPVVWTILYLLMGEASYRVLASGEDMVLIRSALKASMPLSTLVSDIPLLLYDYTRASIIGSINHKLGEASQCLPVPNKP